MLALVLALTVSGEPAPTVTCTNKCQPKVTVVNRIKEPVPVALIARFPIGHTHTCSNGHTWDHSLTSSHNCPVCGLYQNVQDQSPRPVTYSQGTSYSIGGCANGSCSSAKSTNGSFTQTVTDQGGWYLGKNVGKKR